MSDNKNEIKSLAGSDDATCSQIPAEERNFRWAYAALVELAKVCLDKANAEAEPGAWPAQQEWDDLGSTSKSAFLHEAREMAGIPHDEFLEGIRSGAYDVDDLFDSANVQAMASADEKTPPKETTL